MEQNRYSGEKNKNDVCTSVLDFWLESFLRVYQGKKMHNMAHDTNQSAIKMISLAKYSL